MLWHSEALITDPFDMRDSTKAPRFLPSNLQTKLQVGDFIQVLNDKSIEKSVSLYRSVPYLISVMNPKEE